MCKGILSNLKCVLLPLATNSWQDSKIIVYTSIIGDSVVTVISHTARLKLFHNGGAVKYEGARDLKSLSGFVDDHISKTPDEATAEVRAC